MAEESTRDIAPGLLKSVRRRETFRALHNRNYRLLWIGMVGHSASLWAETVARSWLIWQLTGSATLLATVHLLRAIPLLFFGLFAGVAADRFDKRKILIICQSFTLINHVVLAVLIITGVVEVWHVLLTTFLSGCSKAFNQPTRIALIPSLVREDELTNAVALNSVAVNITRIVGPAAAGLLIASLGIGAVYFVAAGVYVIAIACTIMLRVPPVITRLGKTSVWTDMGEVFQYVYKEKTILILVVLALIPLTVAWPYIALLPIFADTVLDIGAPGLGWLYSAIGVGALLAVIIIATLGRVRRKGLVVLLGVFCFGAFLMVFSQSTLVPISLVVMAFVGFVSTGSMVLINTSLLEIAPPELHGRVMGIFRLDHGLMPLGVMVVGVLADAIGVSLTVLIMGSICVLLALSMGTRISLVRRVP
ncbi:MFS transporter [Chloroflexota bacterium]